MSVYVIIKISLSIFQLFSNRLYNVLESILTAKSVTDAAPQVRATTAVHLSANE